MITNIIKRDGRSVPYNISKIAGAIKKSFDATGTKQTDDSIIILSKKVEDKLESQNLSAPSVEQVQDAVEAVLMESGHIRTAKAYVLYRQERSRVREMNTRLMKTFEDITYKDSSSSDLKRDNANINGDTAMGTMLKYGSEGAKEFYEKFVLKPEHSKAHKEGDIHIHDLDFLTLTTTCCQIDLIELFKGGFSTGHGVLREPNDISSYAALACIAIQSNQNDQHGGQSIPNFDYALGMGVKKTYRRLYITNLVKALELKADYIYPIDKAKAFLNRQLEKDVELSISEFNTYCKNEAEYLLKEGVNKEKIEACQQYAKRQAETETDRATYQAMEALIHNLNTMHSRAGAQTPFSSINYGLDTSPEGRMIIKNVLLAQESGLGGSETPIFPIHIFRVKDGINYNESDPNYDLFKLAIRVSAKRLFPNFSFIDAPYNLKYYVKGRPETEVAYMGCRTRVMGNVYDPLREITYGRGNLSFTSINLPRLAIISNKNVNLFFRELERIMELCIDQMNERFELQASKRVINYPFLMGEGVWIDSKKLKTDEEVREILKHGTLSLGFIGLAEALKSLTGFHHGESEAAQNLGIDIISFMRQKLDELSQKTKMNYTLLATPAEGLSGRFVRLDRKLFGVIPGVTDKEYYTNSFHIPVAFKISAFEKIKKEAPYHEFSNAGHITYVELDGDPVKNLDAFEKIIRCMKESGIGYGSINHPVDHDVVCGYSGIIGDVCPKCNRTEGDIKFQRIRRITGYLVGTLDRFNDAKRAEERDRIKHNI